jgi:hypothetical protein
MLGPLEVRAASGEVLEAGGARLRALPEAAIESRPAHPGVPEPLDQPVSNY